MITLDLDGWLTLEVFRTLLVFVRVSAAFMMLPGFGEPSVPLRIRILAGLAIALCVSNAVSGMPAAVPDAGGTAMAAAAEAFSGILIGTLARTIISGVLIAGQAIGQNVGIANIFAPGLAIDQAATIGAVVYAGLTAIMFVSGGDRVILRALVDSYGLLAPGQFPNVSASLRAVVNAGMASFRLGCELAFPFLLLGLVFNAALGVVNRALPAIPVFMIAHPALVVIGLYLLAACAPGIMDAGLVRATDLAALLH